MLMAIQIQEQGRRGVLDMGREWVSGATVVNDDGSIRPKAFSDYSDDALDDESLRMSCN
jgi:hypothetical protein